MFFYISYEEFVEYEKAKFPLFEFLKSLSFDEIVAIETVMTIGRNDRDYYPKTYSEVEIFKDEKETFNYTNTEENKELAIQYILNKSAVLTEHLTRGAEILNISLY